MNYLIYVGIGGAIGAISRYSIYEWLNQLHPQKLYLATFIVNFAGSILVGILFVLAMEKGVISTEARHLLIVGFLGAFTTYSAFSLDTIRLLENGQIGLAGLYVLGTTATCIIGAGLGIYGTRSFF